MNDSPASSFIEKILGKNRDVLLGIIRNMKEFPNDDLTWEAKGNGYVIKKLRK